MAFRYETVGDAQMQLDHTVMMSESGPVYLQAYDGWNYQVQTLLDYDNEIVDIRKAGLTFEPLILGYVNYGHQIAYLGRKPKRMWKQGLSYDNLKAITGFLDDEILQNPSLAKCLLNDYPTMQKAFDDCNQANINVAFHRDVAFIGMDGDEICIEYKGDTIGVIGKGLDFLINDKYTYLKEVLEEIVNENS